MATTSTKYRDVVKEVIEYYAQLRPSHGDIRLDAVFDETRNRYALMQVGWSQGRRVRGNLLYITLQNDKVYIEYDGIGRGITDDLISRGIPEGCIVLAYLPEADKMAVA
jgi:hypothetical protein